MSSAKPDRLVRRALHRRTALVFDFDETLAPNTTDALLEHLGFDPERVRAEQVKPLVDDGWTNRLAEAHVLTTISAGPNGPITDRTFEQVADELELYPVDFMQSHGGLGIAVHQASSDTEWESRGDMRDGRQVVALHRSDFSEGSPLLETLCLSARLAATRIRLLETGR